MSPAVFVGVALAGGAGAMLRYVVDLAARRHFAGYPAGTFAINLSGSFLLGLLVSGIAATDVAGGATAVAVLGTGLLGGYTTFSSAMLEVVDLLEERRLRAALVHSVGMLVGGIACAALGWWCGAQLG